MIKKIVFVTIVSISLLITSVSNDSSSTEVLIDSITRIIGFGGLGLLVASYLAH